MSRRRFAVLAAVAVAAAGTAAGAAWLRRRALRRWLVRVPPGRERPGPLTTRAEDVLRAVAPALLGEPLDVEHYVRFFRWRAEHVAGHRALVERFAARLDRAAARRGAAGFESLEREAQRAVLAGLRPARGWRRAARAVFDRDRARETEHVVRAFLGVFAATEAWVRAGYETWPGTPRLLTVPERKVTG
jgi:hypothetical protein